MATMKAALGGQLKPPKNGRYHVVLFAGGTRDLYARTKDRLGQKGMYAKYHWEYHTTKWSLLHIPTDVDFVILAKTLTSHSDSDALKRMAAAAGVQFISTKHEWTNIQGALQQRIKSSNQCPKIDPREIEAQDRTRMIEAERQLEAEAAKKREEEELHKEAKELVRSSHGTAGEATVPIVLRLHLPSDFKIPEITRDMDLGALILHLAAIERIMAKSSFTGHRAAINMLTSMIGDFMARAGLTEITCNPRVVMIEK